MGNNIPQEFFRDAWEDCEHPMACVGTDNKFVAVNAAFERLLGYSEAEMSGHTWMQYTLHADVGGDLASVNAVIEGRATQYRMDKRYVHKRGHTIPVSLTVRRFPKDLLQPITFFSVQAPVQHATQLELSELQKTHHTTFTALIKRLDEIEKRGTVTVTNQQGDQWRDGDKTGRDKTSNSDQMIKYLCGGVIMMAISLVWIAYYVATTTSGATPQAPPAIVE